MLSGGQAHVLHPLIGIALRIEAGGEQFILGVDAVLFRQRFAEVGEFHVTGHEVIAVEVLCQVQGVIQAVAVLQLHNSLPFIQPPGFALPLFSPGIAKVDGMTDKLRRRAILGENVLQLREAAVHIHGDTLGQRLHLQCVQRQEKFVRVCSVHVFTGVRESNPHAVHVGAACQLDPDSKIAFVGVQRRVTVQKRID